MKRRIVDRNPTPVDDDGYLVDGYCSEERQQEARENVADLNPYSSIRLERRSPRRPTRFYEARLTNSLLAEILAPLTAVTDLPDHPTLSTPFKANTLTELSAQASELMRREQKSLWKSRKLLTGLCGDFVWLPCGPLVGPNDVELFADDGTLQERHKKRPLLIEPINSTPMTNGDKNGPMNGSVTASGTAGTASDTVSGAPSDSAGDKVPDGDDVPMADAQGDSRPDKNSEDQPLDEAGVEKAPAQNGPDASQSDVAPEKNPQAEAPATTENSAPQQVEDPRDKASNSEEERREETKPNGTDNIEMQDADGPDAANAQPTDQPVNGTSQPDADPGEELIHPFFNPPAYPLPDRDVGLPENEAENVRHLMSLYVQKQEEICRGAMRLHEGLMKADRLRRTVLQWARAEAHVGEMSDGEDWYDREEWGLEGELKKGQDEEEEDTTAQPVKKTRNRRA